MIRQAVILVGGYGTRLGNLTKNVPKPYLEVLNKPFLEHIIQNLSRFGLEEILLFSSFKSDIFIENYHEKVISSVKIRVMIETDPLGTGGGLLKFNEHLDEKFFVVNGDTYFDVDLYAVSEFSNSFSHGAIICATHESDTGRFGSIKVDKNDLVTDFIEKNSKTKTPGYINAGLYVFFKETLNLFKKEYLSIENDIFPELKKRKELFALQSEGFFLDIGIKESFYNANHLMKKILTKPAIFLDRDGTINFDNGYTHKIEDLKIIPGATDLIKYYNDQGYYVIVVTNQGGISKGIFSRKDLIKFNQYLRSELAKFGCRIDHFYYCPHHPEAIDKRNRECNCRKPKDGMLRQAVNEFNIDLEKSIIVGDKESDLHAGRAIGIKGYLYESGNIYETIMKKL